MNLTIKNYLWIFPFLSFLLGYSITQHLFHTPPIATPNLIGKNVHEALPLITNYQLNIRLMDQKEEVNIPEGIILNQAPLPGTSIKPHQHILVVTTKKPTAIKAPHCIGITIDQLTEQLTALNITPRIYYLPHDYPERICFAQFPHASLPLEKNHLLLYISSGNNKPIIWPNFNQQPLDSVLNFLNNHDIKTDIINNAPNKNNYNNDYIIKDQRPFAGTLVTLDEKKPLSVQLRIE